MSKILLSLTFLFLFSFNGISQEFRIMGRVIDTTSNQGLINATIILNGITDTTFFKGIVSGEDGRFFMQNIPKGEYKLQVSYVGFDTIIRSINIQEDFRVGKIYLHEAAKLLEGAQVDAIAVKIQQDGDTTNYNANAFKTHQDATAEDLVNKLPGISNENGTLKANGEEVKRVLVDGKPFFGDDAKTTLKTIPADMIDKVQVYDKMSNQAQFTGYDDGSGQKTINLITKNGGKGQFGRVYAGYGNTENFDSHKYSAGGNYNKFNGKQRFTILGMTNNINQQNFTSDDMIGISSGGGYMRGRGGYGGSSGFNMGNSNGIAKTNSIGVNFSDAWKDKWKFTGSYFLNYNHIDNASNLSRNYITKSDSNIVYNEINNSYADNLLHKASIKLDFEPDTLNEFTLETKFNYQSNFNESSLLGNNAILSALQSSLDNSNNSDFNGYTLNNEFSYRRRLNKIGRTISAELNSSLNSNVGKTQLFSQNVFYLNNDSSLVDQRGNQNNFGQTHDLEITYTESLGKKTQLLISYLPSISLNNTDKETDNYDLFSGEYSSLDTLLTNIYENKYSVQRAGLGINYNTEKHILNVGLDGQLANLSGKTTFPVEGTISKNFQSLLPNVMYMLKFSRTESIRLRYRTSTAAPSVNQLQEVVNNSNPLFLSSGNASLNQSYTHMIFWRYSKTNMESGKGIFLMMHARLTTDYIGNQTLIPASDTTLTNGIYIPKGAQLSRQVNLNGYKSVSTYFTYSIPAKKIKSNISINSGINFNRVPALINEDLNLADNLGLGAGLTIASNVSEKLDFTIGYNGGYNFVTNSLQSNSDNNYYFHNASIKLNWNFWKGFNVNTNATQTLYNGLGDGFNQTFTLLNLEVGYKFLKEKQLDVRIGIFDLLNQNTNISRTVTETYIEDYSSLVLNRYFMLTVSYKLKKIGELPKEEKQFWMKH